VFMFKIVIIIHWHCFELEFLQMLQMSKFFGVCGQL
jgi:hypothetical protein